MFNLIKSFVAIATMPDSSVNAGNVTTAAVSVTHRVLYYPLSHTQYCIISHYIWFYR